MISTKQIKEKSVENLLSLITEYDIYKFYIGPEFCLGCNISSPLRVGDGNPSFSTFKGPKGLKWKDFGTGKSGDFIEFMKEKFGLSYLEVLNKLYVDLDQIKSQAVPYYFFPGIQVKREIKIKKRDFTKFDLDYWQSYGSNQQILKKYEVSGLKKYWLIEGSKEMAFTCIKDNPVYSYHYGSNFYRLYAPFDSNYKWRTNSGSEILQGWNQLPLEGEKVILSKSLKDIMCLFGQGYTACGPQSEHTIIPETTIANLMSRFKEVIVFFDNDRGGIEASKRYERYNFKSVFLPSGSKDISDYYKEFGENKTKLILKEIL